MKKFRCYITNEKFTVGTTIDEFKYNSLSSELKQDFRIVN